jgi:hypothetical protein
MVDKTLDQGLSEKNIILRFKSTRIWPLDPKAMDEVTRPNSLYMVLNQTKEEQNHDHQSNREEYGKMEWAKQNVTEELINITSTTKLQLMNLCLIMWLKINLGIMWTCL